MDARDPDREATLNEAARFLIERLGEQGVAATPVLTEHGKMLAFEGGGMLSMENLVDDMLGSPVSQWYSVLQRWVAFALEEIRERDVSLMDVDAIHAMIRTRVVPADSSNERAYARPFCEGLVQVLCLDHPTSVVTLGDEAVGTLGGSIDQLFAQGQANTDAELIDEIFEDSHVGFASGASMFIASKVGNIPALLGQLDINAPDGLLFAIPNRSLLLWIVPEKSDPIGAVISLANVMRTLTPDAGFDNPGGLLSKNLYYWSPDGTVESMLGSFHDSMKAVEEAGHKLDVEEADTTVVRPGPSFSQRFIANRG